MPQKPHTIPSTPPRGSGVLPAMVSVAAVCDRRRPQGRDAAPSGSNKGAWASRPCRPKASLPIDDLSIRSSTAPISIQNPKSKIQNPLPSASPRLRVNPSAILDRMTESERSGERLPTAARRVSIANQFAGWTGGEERRGLDGNFFNHEEHEFSRMGNGFAGEFLCRFYSEI